MRSTTVRGSSYEKRTRIILSVRLALLLVIGTGGYAYASDYYHADETALEALAYQTDRVQAEQDGDGIPTISGEEQLRQTTEAIRAFIGRQTAPCKIGIKR